MFKHAALYIKLPLWLSWLRNSLISKDGDGNVTSVTNPVGGSSTYTYDTSDRLATETTTSGGTISYTYNSLNLISELTNARGQKRDYTYDGARDYVWQVCKKNYYDKGVRIFWLDEAEPEFGPYDFDLYRYYQGSALQCSNIYPAMYAKGYYDGMTAEGQENICNLVRSAWAGSQRYGALIWSGDVSSTFRAMREQLQIGLNMGIAGIPWWTTDIGGFLGGYVEDDNFQELLLR